MKTNDEINVDIVKHLFGLEASVEQIVGVTEQLLAGFFTQLQVVTQVLSFFCDVREVEFRLLLSVAETHSIRELTKRRKKNIFHLTSNFKCLLQDVTT